MAIKGENEKDTITFHLIKSEGFQTHRIDGAIGSLSPNGLCLSFYVERAAIPRQVTHELDSNGELGKMISAQGKSGIVRELQTGIILDVETARSLREQLDTVISTLDEKSENDSH